MKIITNALSFKLFPKLKSQDNTLKMKKKFALFVFLLCLFSMLSCRNSSSRGKSKHEQVRNNSEQFQPNKSVRGQSIKRSKSPLSGSEIFKRYNNAVFMVFTSDGRNQ